MSLLEEDEDSFEEFLRFKRPNEKVEQKTTSEASWSVPLRSTCTIKSNAAVGGHRTKVRAFVWFVFVVRLFDD
jgi:hypothetical protein